MMQLVNDTSEEFFKNLEYQK